MDRAQCDLFIFVFLTKKKNFYPSLFAKTRAKKGSFLFGGSSQTLDFPLNHRHLTTIDFYSIKRCTMRANKWKAALMKQ